VAKNRYKINEDFVIIYLDRKDGSVLETVIDIADFDKILGYKYKWYAKYDPNTNGYYVYSTVYNGSPKRGFKNTTVKLNKYILDYTGSQEIDHIDHNTLNNRKHNLRIALFSENSKHRKDKNSNNKSGYRNVCFINGWYRIQLQVDGKNHRFSEKFENPEEANEFAKAMRQTYYGAYSGK